MSDYDTSYWDLIRADEALQRRDHATEWFGTGEPGDESLPLDPPEDNE